jgi:hypothetical protein
MWPLDAVDLMDQFALREIEDQYGFIVFRRREQTVSLEIDSEVIEVPFDRRGQCDGLHEAHRNAIWRNDCCIWLLSVGYRNRKKG